MKGTLIFHSPCFDGIASAVLMADFLEGCGWNNLQFSAANYHLRTTWLSTPLPDQCAVVDFLYHPDARFWADHHGTTFLSDVARADFMSKQPDSALVYDAAADSCAGLLWRHLHFAFGFRIARHEELVQWAEKTDAAHYVSVAEVFAAQAPAIRINASLALAPNREAYCVRLVQALRGQSLAEVADIPEVRKLSREALERQQDGLESFREAAHLTPDAIVVFDVADEAERVNRYSPYYFFPDARYSAGIIRHRDGALITAMRNPWREFPCAPLGRRCEPLGGGGHPRIGAIALQAERSGEAGYILANLLEGIRAFHKHPG